MERHAMLSDKAQMTSCEFSRCNTEEQSDAELVLLNSFVQFEKENGHHRT